MISSQHLDMAGYLARLGLDRRPEPTVDTLFALQRAHVERVAYENIEIQLERPTSLDPLESTARIVAGRGGYCFHLNGALGALLDALGFDVSLHLGDVRKPQDDAENSPVIRINHAVLTVRCAGESWFVDAGLGDGLYEPIPLRVGEYRQGPFTYGFAPWQGQADIEGQGSGAGWRFTHAPAASFTSMVFTVEPVSLEAFAEAHERLSTSPDSSFVKALSVGRRDADGFDVMRGRVLTRVDSAGTWAQAFENAPEWYACLAKVFDLPLDDVDAAAREKLWDRVSAAHQAWVAAESDDDQAAAISSVSTAGTLS